MSQEILIVKRSLLDQASTNDMFALYEKYYANVCKNTFLSDLLEKEWVIILRSGDKTIGFSTIQIIQNIYRNKRIAFLFSGDTIVDQAHRQQYSLAGAFGQFFSNFLEKNPNIPLYWFLITKGFRTYRFLPVFFKDFYPRYSDKTPIEIQEIIDHVAYIKFKSTYDPKSGCIKGGPTKDRLRPEHCETPTHRLSDPHINYFINRNPNFHLGEELACITPISMQNLNPSGFRVIKATNVCWIT